MVCTLQREEELDSPESLIGTEQHSYFAQKEIAGAAAVSEEIEVEERKRSKFARCFPSKVSKKWQQPFNLQL
jgi:hypothetical protein